MTDFEAAPSVKVMFQSANSDFYIAKKGLASGQLAHGGREALQKAYGVVVGGPFFTQSK